MRYFVQVFTPLRFIILFSFFINISLIDGQVFCHLPNGDVAPIYFNVALVMNQSYLDDLPTYAAAREFAETKTEAAIQVLQTVITNNQYNLQIKLFFVSTWIPAPQINMGNEAYIQAVKTQFDAAFLCFHADGLVILRKGSGHGSGSNGLGGILLGNEFMQNSLRAAHEFGHLIGLDHCCSTCTDCPPSIMCFANIQTYFTTSCEIHAMNHSVISAESCPKLLDVQNSLPDDFTCPIIIVPTVSIISDQPYLLEASKGCTPDRSLSMYTVSLNGGPAGISNAKLEVWYQNQVY